MAADRLCAYSSVLLVLVALAAAAGGLSDADRVAKLDSVRAGKRDGVLSLTIDTFRKYVETAPRSYSLLVLLTADPSMCKPCEVMRREFGDASAGYYKASQSVRSSHPVFFAELKLSLADQTFLAEYGIQHVPVLYHFGPALKNKYPSKLVVPGPSSYDLQGQGIGANPIKTFINARTRSKLPVTRSNYQIPFVSTVRTFLPAIFMTLAAIELTAIYLGWIYQPLFWFACVVVVYMYSVGGGHYSWIHDTAFAVVGQSGDMQYVADGSRNQYVAEGMFVSFTCSTISALIIAINEMPRFISSKNSQTAVGLSLFVLTVASITALLLLYNVKMPSYMVYDQ
jgi:OST3 / OST6 family, transporter family